MYSSISFYKLLFHGNLGIFIILVRSWLVNFIFFFNLANRLFSSQTNYFFPLRIYKSNVELNSPLISTESETLLLDIIWKYRGTFINQNARDCSSVCILNILCFNEILGLCWLNNKSQKFSFSLLSILFWFSA